MIGGESEHGSARGQTNAERFADKPAEMKRARRKVREHALEKAAFAVSIMPGRPVNLARIQPAGKNAVCDQQGAQAITNVGIETGHKLARTLREQMSVGPGIRLQTSPPTMRA